jgi:hypothetical protein
MDSKTTQGTSSASMIILATVVFPEALPPPRPVRGGGWYSEDLMVRSSWSGYMDGCQRCLPTVLSPMAKASLDCVPCSLYQGGRPAV